MNLVSYSIGSKSMTKGGNLLYLSFYNPAKHTYTFIDKDFNLEVMHREVIRIKGMADTWISGLL